MERAQEVSPRDCVTLSIDRFPPPQSANWGVSSTLANDGSIAQLLYIARTAGECVGIGLALTGVLGKEGWARTPAVAGGNVYLGLAAVLLSPHM